jgi:hypothetical protein
MPDPENEPLDLALMVDLVLLSCDRAHAMAEQIQGRLRMLCGAIRLNRTMASSRRSKPPAPKIANVGGGERRAAVTAMVIAVDEEASGGQCIDGLIITTDVFAHAVGDPVPCAEAIHDSASAPRDLQTIRACPEWGRQMRFVNRHETRLFHGNCSGRCGRRLPVEVRRTLFQEGGERFYGFRGPRSLAEFMALATDSLLERSQ